MGSKNKLKKPIIFNTTFTTYTAGYAIGEGGSGKIYEAVDDSGNTYAIKWLHPISVSKEKVKRFKNEVQFCLRNKHPNIVTIIDHGFLLQEQTKLPFYVMPLYSCSLRDLLQKTIPSNKVLTYFAQILDGIEAAHLKGVVHRDLKPENILYEADTDKLLVADFGIAHFEEEELYTAIETKDTTRLANFQYAAPEQRTRGTKVDSRVDIYSLGLMLNEMFTGEVPYGTGFKTIAQVSPEHGYLDDIISNMIRQSPQDRPASIEAVKEQLIGRKNEFINRQQISKLREEVIPVTEVDDPLIVDPPRIVNFDWDHGTLTLILHRPVNRKWEWAFHNMGNYSFTMGKEPQHFHISGDKAVIQAHEHEVQGIIDIFKSWLPIANRKYEDTIRREKQKVEEDLRKQLQLRIEQEEARQRVLKATKL